MARRKNTTPAQIINHLRKAEVELANGKTVREVCKGLEISEHTYYRWRRVPVLPAHPDTRREGHLRGGSEEHGVLLAQAERFSQ